MNGVGARSTAGTPSAFREIGVRHATPDDREFVMSLVPRVVGSSPLHWRNRRKVHAAYVTVVESVLQAERDDAALLVAEYAAGALLGWVLLAGASDCYTHRRLGLVAQIVVLDVRESTRAGLALATGAKAFADSRKCPVLSLREFWNSHPAGTIQVAAMCGDERLGSRRPINPVAQIGTLDNAAPVSLMFDKSNERNAVP